MKLKGSVTLFLSLLLAVILGVFQVLFQSLRIAGGRVQAEAGVEEGLYSVFSGYHRELFDRYRVFFLDAGYGSAGFRPEIMLNIVETSLEQSCYSGKRENLWNCTREMSAVTGYTLATDNNGAAFYEQAVDYMKDTLGIQGIQLLADQLTQQKSTVEEQKIQGDYDSAKEAQEVYEQKKEEQMAGETGLPGDEQQTQADPDPTAAPLVEVPAGFQNPLDIIRQVQNMGLLGLVFPADRQLSQAEVRLEELPSHRQLECGMGMGIAVPEEGITEQLLFLQYMMEHLGCFGEEQAQEGLRYQLEYVIGGKDSDKKNLEFVVKELLAVRTAANMVHLLTDTGKQAQAHQMAMVIGSAVGLPFLESVISLALQAAWSFGESVLDIRCLLDGGKIPLVKDAGSWQLSLENLSKILELLNQEPDTGDEGMTYQQYLRLLLFMKSGQTRLERTMDMAEQQIRAGGQENFSLDRCVYSLEVEMKIRCENREFTILRSYGYGM